MHRVISALLAATVVATPVFGATLEEDIARFRAEAAERSEAMTGELLRRRVEEGR